MSHGMPLSWRQRRFVNLDLGRKGRSVSLIIEDIRPLKRTPVIAFGVRQITLRGRSQIVQVFIL
jgi:hypothetical protein